MPDSDSEGLSARGFINTLRPRDPTTGRFGRWLAPDTPEEAGGPGQPGEDPRQGHFSPHADEVKTLYLAQLDAGAGVRAACDAVGVPYSVPYGWRSRDPEFAAAWDVLRPARVAFLEGHLDRIADGDGMPAVIATLSQLKARDPEHYARPERQQETTVLDRLGQHFERLTGVLERAEQRVLQDRGLPALPEGGGEDGGAPSL